MTETLRFIGFKSFVSMMDFIKDIPLRTQQQVTIKGYGYSKKHNHSFEYEVTQ